MVKVETFCGMDFTKFSRSNRNRYIKEALVKLAHKTARKKVFGLELELKTKILNNDIYNLGLNASVIESDKIGDELDVRQFDANALKVELDEKTARTIALPFKYSLVYKEII